MAIKRERVVACDQTKRLPLSTVTCALPREPGDKLVFGGRGRGSGGRGFIITSVQTVLFCGSKFLKAGGTSPPMINTCFVRPFIPLSTPLWVMFIWWFLISCKSRDCLHSHGWELSVIYCHSISRPMPFLWLLALFPADVIRFLFVFQSAKRSVCLGCLIVRHAVIGNDTFEA